MSPDHPEPLRGALRLVSDATGDRAPSQAAQARLSGALRDRADAYRHDASLDLTIVEALLRMDQAEAAVKTLDEHRAALAAMARDLQVVVADAAVEREAEAVVDAVAAKSFSASSRPARTGVRRRVLAMAGAAAVVVALVLPTARFSPRTTLTSAEDRSAANDLAVARERLEAAKSWARVLRGDGFTPPARTPGVAQPRASTVPNHVPPSLAADTSGGSAAASSPSSAEVTDLTAYREQRRATTPPDDPDDPPPPDEPTAVDVPDLDVDVPQPETPLHFTAPVDADDFDTEIETPLP